MTVLFTLAVLVVAALWIMAVLRRLSLLRGEVKLVWKKLESDQSNEAVKSVYNRHVAKYNQALDSFPANLIGPIAGFTPAKHF